MARHFFLTVSLFPCELFFQVLAEQGGKPDADCGTKERANHHSVGARSYPSRFEMLPIYA
jgi:hypothetical protein